MKISHNKNLYDELKKATMFLDAYIQEHIPKTKEKAGCREMKIRWYCFSNGVWVIPYCKCGKQCSFTIRTNIFLDNCGGCYGSKITATHEKKISSIENLFDYEYYRLNKSLNKNFARVLSSCRSDRVLLLKKLCDNKVIKNLYFDRYKGFVDELVQKTHELDAILSDEFYDEQERNVIRRRYFLGMIDLGGFKMCSVCGSKRVHYAVGDGTFAKVCDSFVCRTEENRRSLLTSEGIENPAQRQETKDKISKSWEEKFIKKIELQKDLEYVGSESRGMCKSLHCNKHNFDFKIWQGAVQNRLEANIPLCYKCMADLGLERFGGEEKEVRDYVESLGFKTDKKFWIVDGIKRQVDIFIEELNLGIEYNGDIRHSTLYRKDENYHKSKKIFFDKLGINVINIWSHQRLLKKDRVKNFLKMRLGKSETVSARELYIEQVSGKKAKAFFDEYHLQGGSSLGETNVSLFDGSDMVACISVKKKNGDSFELKRYATSKKITGGFERLIGYVNNFCGVKKLSSRADCDIVDINNNVYSRNGFSKIKHSEPGYRYIKSSGGEPVSRYAAQKKKLLKKYPQFVGIVCTEKSIMKEMGYYEVHNCGNLLYEKTF